VENTQIKVNFEYGGGDNRKITATNEGSRKKESILPAIPRQPMLWHQRTDRTTHGGVQGEKKNNRKGGTEASLEKVKLTE